MTDIRDGAHRPQLHWGSSPEPVPRGPRPPQLLPDVGAPRTGPGLFGPTARTRARVVVRRFFCA